jgi:subtilisin family serine protease
VKLHSESQTAAFLENAATNPAIEYAEPNYILHTVGTRDNPPENIPNVADFGRLWGMKNTGQTDAEGTVGLVGADIGATKAWAVTTGNKDIAVAVIDTGVDYTHPELKENIFVNSGEIADNGIDDDANGFIDDIHGWNFAGVSTNNPMDDNEHGTHVSGTIGAKGDGAGNKIAGVTWNTSILPVKFLTGSGSGTLADAVKAIQYATKMNVKIMSNSWGGGGFSQAMYDAINEAKIKGILFVAAAGNDSANSDSSPHYPAGYQIDNVMAVAATTNRDTLASFSTYGKRTVHIAAPGHKIYSSIKGGGYNTFSGTSMATPHVSGAAALVWGANPSLTYAEIKERLMKSRDFIPALSRKVASSGRLNVYNAVMGIYPVSPEPSEDQWRDIAFNPAESAHPYANSFKQEFAFEAPENVKFMRVVFSKVELEDGYDFLKVVDGAGKEMDSISGRGTDTPTYYVEGNKLTLKFSTDSSQTFWGFAVSKVQVVYK